LRFDLQPKALTMMIPTGRAGESIPQLVMRTGIIRPVRPENARRDVSISHVEAATRLAVGQPMSPAFLPPTPGPLSPAAVTPTIPAPPSPTTSAVAQCAVATPPAPLPVAPAEIPSLPSDRHHWHRMHRHVHPLAADIRRLHPNARLHGADDVLLGEWNGRPVAKFQVASAPTRPGAESAVNALRQAAHILRQTGLGMMPPELVAGPLAALMRGGAVELHFQNGVVARTAL
jgi:hypothetical protein